MFQSTRPFVILSEVAYPCRSINRMGGAVLLCCLSQVCPHPSLAGSPHHLLAQYFMQRPGGPEAAKVRFGPARVLEHCGTQRANGAFASWGYMNERRQRWALVMPFTGPDRKHQEYCTSPSTQVWSTRLGASPRARHALLHASFKTIPFIHQNDKNDPESSQRCGP